MNSSLKLLLGISVIATTLLLVACSSPRKTQQWPALNPSSASPELYDTIRKMDSLLFDGFNRQDLEVQKQIFDRDVEFYHDKGGLTRYEQVMENTKRLFAMNNGLKRTLIAGSLEVYPIKDFGAIEIGMHRFCHRENGKDDCGTFRFLHVWKSTPAGWKLTRVISYGH